MNEKSYWISVGVKTTGFSRAFLFFYFWISVFLDFFISGFILGRKRPIGDPLVTKEQDFQGLFRFSMKVWISGFRGLFNEIADFGISRFPYFWIS